MDFGETVQAIPTPPTTEPELRGWGSSPVAYYLSCTTGTEGPAGEAADLPRKPGAPVQ
jgi:hypothetical protein